MYEPEQDVAEIRKKKTLQTEMAQKQQTQTNNSEIKQSFLTFARHLNKSTFGKFIIFISLFKFAVFIASPFFALYMLKVLHFSYFQFTVITLSSVFFSIIGMKIFGYYNDKTGSKNVILFSGFLIPLIPILWLFTKNFYLLFAIEAFSGFIWAGFNLSASNYIYDNSTKDDIMDHISYFNIFHTFFILLGSFAGSLLINYSFPSIDLSNKILMVFLISGIFRLLVAIIFIPTLKEMRLIEISLDKGFFRKFVSIKHVQGVVFETIGHYDKSIQTKRLYGNPNLQKNAFLDKASKFSLDKEKNKEYYQRKSIANLLKNVKK